MKQDKIPTQQIISTTPFPNSKKIYVKGKLNDIEVAMREITLSDTKLNWWENRKKSTSNSI
jgi:phosphomethylpyrimidine synthase